MEHSVHLKTQEQDSLRRKCNTSIVNIYNVSRSENSFNDVRIKKKKISLVISTSFKLTKNPVHSQIC